MFALLFVMTSADNIAHHSLFERLVAGGLGVAFMSAGALFAFGKNGIVIDSSECVIREWNGLSSLKFVTDTFPFDEFSRFALEQQGPHTYVVIVQGGNTTVTLLSSHSYAVAREHADKIAAFLPFDCHDEVQDGTGDRTD
jgi:hypothetical protein